MNIRNVLALLAALFLCKEAKSQEFTTIYPSADMWMGTKYNTTSQNNDFIRIGGWGDRYYGFWKFDWSKIRSDMEVEKIHLYLNPDSSNQLINSASLWLLTTPWNEKTSKISDPLRGINLGSFTMNKSKGAILDITSLYRYWVDDGKPNHGILLYPGQNDNKWYFFPSRESGNANRAKALVYYKSTTHDIPNFKLPLPGGKEWRVNTVIGDQNHFSHSGLHHFSVDFGHYTKNGNREYDEQNVRIYASAAGVVTESAFQARTDSEQKNGHYVVIDHDGDGNVHTGFQTRYIHLAAQSPLKKGDHVKQGQFVGIMGKTGTDAVHLHFGVRYKNSGENTGETGRILSKVRIDGTYLSDFKEGRYYMSTNTR